MKTYLHLRQYLTEFFLEYDMIQTNVQKTTTHFVK